MKPSARMRSLDADAVKQPPQCFAGVEILFRNLPGRPRVYGIVCGYFFEGGGRLLDVANGEQAATARQARSESGILRHHRASARQVRRAALTEPARLHRDESVLAYRELAPRGADIVSVGIDRHCHGVRVPEPPTGGRKALSRNIISGDRQLDGTRSKARQLHEFV